MIDWDRVADLWSDIGAEGFADVLELFLEEVEEVVARLGTGPNSLEEDLHFLKGSAWNLGFAAFGAACQDAERKAVANLPVADDIPEVLRSYADSKTAFLAGLEAFAARQGAVA